jgi:hypothetical protein
MFPEFLRSCLVALCTIVLLSLPAWAQPHHLRTSFGPCVERLLDAVPVNLCVTPGRPDMRPVIAVLCQEHPLLRFYHLDDSARIVDAGTADLPSPQQCLAAAEFDSSGRTAYVMLDRTGRQVTILAGEGATAERKAIPVPVGAQHLLIADFNNDGFKDILLYGKNMAGVATLMGRKDGSFTAGPLLFPEVSVSDLRTSDINGDGITDVVLLNWLSNQLMVYYGISHGIFSEQVSIALPGEPAEIALGPVTRRRTMRAAVTIPQEHQVIQMTIDGAGEITIDGTIDCPGTPHGVFLGQVNIDPWLDLVTATDKGTLVALGTPQADFAPPAVFGAGAASLSWAVADVDGDRRPDLVIAGQSERKLVVIGNAEHVGRTAWPDVYAVGSWPRGLAVSDFNGDGWADICVVNSGSSTASFLMNRGNGKMFGQVSVNLPDNPASVTTAGWTSPGVLTVITTHPQSEKIGVIAIGDTLPRSETFALPTGSNPHLLFARTDSLTGGLAMLVRTRAGRDGSISLSLFEQLAGGQFLERSLRPNLPQRIIALTVNDFSGSKAYDLVFATNDRSTRLSTVSLATGTPGFDFKGVRELFTYPDSLSSTKMIFTGRVDEDSFPDLVLSLGSPYNSLAIAYGKGGGTFRDTLEWIRNVRPLRDDEIVIRDVNGDGLNDLVFLDAERNAVIAVYGVGAGRFAPPAVVAPGKGVTGLAVGRLRKSGGDDLVLSHGERGVVSIMFAPFVKGGR